MSNRFANGAKAFGFCDVCGFRFDLKKLKNLTVKTKRTATKACPQCWTPDHPQLQLGMYPISDPQALRDPRPDTNTWYQSGVLANGSIGEGSRVIQWGWNPVGGAGGAASGLVPNDLVSQGQIGQVQTPGTVLGVPAPPPPPPPPPPPASIFLDTFTGAAGNLSSHTPDIGSPWTDIPSASPGLPFLFLDGGGKVYAQSLTAPYVWTPITLISGGLFFNMEVEIPASPEEGYTTSFILDDIVALHVVSVSVYWSIAQGWAWEIFDNSGVYDTGLFSPALGTRTLSLYTNGSTRTVVFDGATLHTSSSAATPLVGAYYLTLALAYTGSAFEMRVYAE